MCELYNVNTFDSASHHRMLADSSPPPEASTSQLLPVTSTTVQTHAAGRKRKRAPATAASPAPSDPGNVNPPEYVTTIRPFAPLILTFTTFKDFSLLALTSHRVPNYPFHVARRLFPLATALISSGPISLASIASAFVTHQLALIHQVTSCHAVRLKAIPRLTELVGRIAVPSSKSLKMVWDSQAIQVSEVRVVTRPFARVAGIWK